MKITLLAVLIFLTINSKAFCQYVASTIQQRIQNDQQAISLDQQDIATKQADIDSIVNDQSAQAVTKDVPAIQAVQATEGVVSGQPVSGT